MTLRARLLLASAVILGVVTLAAVGLRQTQQSFLVDDVDAQLHAARPFVRFPPPDLDGDGRADASVRPDEPISSLFIGTIEDGEVVTVLQGRLLHDTPALEVDDSTLERLLDSGAITVEGREGSTRFRLDVMRPDDDGPVSVVALPLDEVDAAVRRLSWGLAGVTAVIAGVLALAVWWVERLGLRPVARLTAAADAITRGARGHRVTSADPRTEAGRLASAFNVMLDERDATEGRLRQFVADASHELRTPLTSIRGYLDLYREGGFRCDGELDDILRRMSQEARRMQSLVEDLLLLARLDQRPPLRRELVDVAALVHDIATDARAVQPGRRIVVDTGNQPAMAECDPYQLQQVVAALVSNALLHTDAAAELHLATEATAADTRITVADTGPGLSPADAARVFDRFYRGDRSRARRTGGSGLGLAIATSIVEAHGGTIALDTAPDRGCRFAVTLPAPTAPTQNDRPDPTPSVDQRTDEQEHERSAAPATTP